MNPRTFTLVALLAIAAGAQGLVLGELFVSGVTVAEQDYVKSILPLEAGEVFPSMGDLERRARVAEYWLQQDGGFGSVAIELEEISDSEAALYVFLGPASIGGRPVFDEVFTVVPHFPIYASGFGFAVGAAKQAFALDLPLDRRLGLDLVLAREQTRGGTEALTATLGPSFSPSPLLRLYLPLEVEAYPRQGEAWPLDVALMGGGRLDLSFLEALCPLGIALEGSLRKGLGDFDYLALEGSLALSLQPLPLLSFRSVASLYTLAGKSPPLRSVDESGALALRVPPLAAIEGGGLASASVTGTLSLPGRVNLGVMKLALAAYGFYESWQPFTGLGELGGGSWPGALGGGLSLKLSPPFSLAFEIGYGYSLSEGRSLFLFSVK